MKGKHDKRGDGKTPKVSKLRIGWRVDDDLHPTYWRYNEHAKKGEQKDSDLVTIDPRNMANHCAIVAQSGSGKSYFLGRIIEELLLETRSRCLVFDPNSDFSKIFSTKDEQNWEEDPGKLSYNSDTGLGFLTHERVKKEFEDRWRKIYITVHKYGCNSDSYHQQLFIPWEFLSAEFIAADVEPAHRVGIMHCHEFMKRFGLIYNLRDREGEDEKKERSFILEARTVLEQIRNVGTTEFRERIESYFDEAKKESSIRKLMDYILPLTAAIGTLSVSGLGSKLISIEDKIESEKKIKEILEFFENATKEDLLATLTTSIDYIKPEVENQYFGIMDFYRVRGLISEKAFNPSGLRFEKTRLDVIDLASLDSTFEKLSVVDAVLRREWETARNSYATALEVEAEADFRAPTFIIIDEAHNLVPSDKKRPAAEALREQIRTIAAEGRKFGLFLILVTQRPDKLDRLVVSECRNVAVMRLGSGAVLENSRSILGLEDIEEHILKRCLGFRKGRAVLIGPWAGGDPVFTYSAARRTQEGGRDLKADNWAIPI